MILRLNMIPLRQPTVEPFQVNRAELAAALNYATGTGIRVDHADVARAITFVLAHLDAPLDIEVLAAGLSVSRRTLERRIQSHLGVSPRRMITLVRLEVARQMLIRTAWPVTDVAVAVGFSSHAGMCNVFRRELGHSPGELRRRLTKSE
ncbi:MAG: helix-turn-helix transcriptional regulator [Planctomycetia bacterium]|nr:helix-turn-helix transcriptional regulator [Planctomycetia bacterium]